jgi:hypothetical protein
MNACRVKRIEDEETIEDVVECVSLCTCIVSIRLTHVNLPDKGTFSSAETKRSLGPTKAKCTIRCPAACPSTPFLSTSSGVNGAITFKSCFLGKSHKMICPDSYPATTSFCV